MCLHLIRIG